MRMQFSGQERHSARFVAITCVALNMGLLAHLVLLLVACNNWGPGETGSLFVYGTDASGKPAPQDEAGVASWQKFKAVFDTAPFVFAAALVIMGILAVLMKGHHLLKVTLGWLPLLSLEVVAWWVWLHFLIELSD